MKIVDENGRVINVLEMLDGQVAVICAWGASPQYIGRIIQRYDISLIELGRYSGKSWRDCFKTPSTFGSNEYMVRILPKGTMLEI